MASKLHGTYKDMDKSVVEMALQVCDWDETRAKNVLDRMKEDTRYHLWSISSRYRSILVVAILWLGREMHAKNDLTARKWTQCIISGWLVVAVDAL